MIAAFLLGLAGSLHCAGMCGPLVLAVPFGPVSKGAFSFRVFLYHLGRISVYAFFGLLLGFFGTGLSFIGLQQNISIVTGLLMLILAFWPLFFENWARKTSWWQHLSRFANRRIQKIWSKPTTLSYFALGTLNGLLPCGMVYAALVGALAGGSPTKGAVFMVLYGLGTLPLLLLISFSQKLIKPGIRLQIRRLQPYILMLVALLLIHRGIKDANYAFLEAFVPGARLDCH